MRNNQYTATKLSERVVERVADAKGVSPLELSPLFEVVDPDALDDLFHEQVVIGEEIGHIQFKYEGYVVSADINGNVGVSETGE